VGWEAESLRNRFSSAGKGALLFILAAIATPERPPPGAIDIDRREGSLTTPSAFFDFRRVQEHRHLSSLAFTVTSIDTEVYPASCQMRDTSDELRWWLLHHDGARMSGWIGLRTRLGASNAIGLRKCFQAFQLALALGSGSSRGILKRDACFL
jgi:hypothetical protein